MLNAAFQENLGLQFRSRFPLSASKEVDVRAPVPLSSKNQRFLIHSIQIADPIGVCNSLNAQNAFRNLSA